MPPLILTAALEHLRSLEYRAEDDWAVIIGPKCRKPTAPLEPQGREPTVREPGMIIE